MRPVAIDTNILAYAAMQGEDPRHEAAMDLQASLIDRPVVVATQVMGELYNVLVRKARMPTDEAAELVHTLTGGYRLIGSDHDDMADALALAASHNFQIWDALILCVAARAGCGLLLSEDMHDGFVYRGTTVANPFAEKPHPLLASLLESTP